MTEQEQLTTPTDPPPFVALFQMVTGYYISQAIYVAARLGIADRLMDRLGILILLSKTHVLEVPSTELCQSVQGCGVIRE